MKTAELTERQVRILDFVRAYHARHGLSPSIREICDGTELTSTSVTRYNLKKLESAGRLRLVGDKARGIVLPDTATADLRAVVADHAANLDLLAAEVYDLDRDTLHRALTARAEGLRAALATAGVPL